MSKKVAPWAKKRSAEITADLFSGDNAKVARADESQWHESEELQQQLLEDLHLMSDIEALSEDAEIQKALSEIEVDRQQSDDSSAARKFWPYALAATLLLGAVSLVWFAPQEQMDVDIKRYVTRTGEQKTLQLEDGSTLTLNTATRLLVEFSPNERRVTLDAGEAYFDVASDSNRPFSVQVDGRSVTALGTEFNVHSTPDSFELAVVEGVVAIHHPDVAPSMAAPLLSEDESSPRLLNGQYRVEAGTVVDYNLNQHSMVVSVPSDMNAIHQWRTGMIGFNAVPLSEVVKELNRYSAKKILIEDASILDLKLYAGVKLDRLDLSLMGIEASLPVTVNTYVDRIVIVGREEK